MTSRLETQLANLQKLNEQRTVVLTAIDEARKEQTIPCKGCDGEHRVVEYSAIQTHEYIRPHGHTGGDYWIETELQLICPTTGVANRILFNTDDVPWEERREYQNDPDAQFKGNYRHLFLSVEDEHEAPQGKRWINNGYVDKNRREFGLVAKRKS